MQDLNAGTESESAQHCTSKGPKSSLFLFSCLNAIFEMLYPSCLLISATNYPHQLALAWGGSIFQV